MAAKSCSKAATQAAVTAASEATAGGRVWRRLCTSRHELSISLSLRCGQSFGWKPINDDCISFIGTVNDTAIALRTAASGATEYQVLHPGTSTTTVARSRRDDDAIHHVLTDYFQLETKLRPLYAKWATADQRMQTAVNSLPGLRVLRQPPLECLISFICSSNNNIARITGMLTSLRQRYGTHLTDHGSEPIHAFPTLEQLSAVTEEELRDLGFGYRAKFVVKTVDTIAALGGDSYLYSLRRKSTQEVQDALMRLHGVGRKVADCVALFSLDQRAAIPVDTHVWQIAVRDYEPSLTTARSLTPAIYDRVGSLFRSRFGDHAGWAHSVLFAAELPVFAPLLPEAFVQSIQEFRAKEKEAKRARAAKGGGHGSRSTNASPTKRSKQTQKRQQAKKPKAKAGKQRANSKEEDGKVSGTTHDKGTQAEKAAAAAAAGAGRRGARNSHTGNDTADRSSKSENSARNTEGLRRSVRIRHQLK